MELNGGDQDFRKQLYRNLDPARPLQPGDPLYQPVYSHPGCEDPIALLQDSIELSEVESLALFSGFRGSGKTTELFRLRQNLEASGHPIQCR